MMRGFVLNGELVRVLNTYDQEAVNEKSFHSNFRSVAENGIDFFFLPIYKNVNINRIKAKKAIKSFLRKWKTDHPDSVIIIDVLKPYAEYIYRYCRALPVVSIVTDLPEHLYFGRSLKSSLRRQVKLYNFKKMISKSAAYIFLTEKMNLRLNRSGKPYVIIEGLVDSEQNKQSEFTSTDKFVCLYSGALHARYGIDTLVEAFTLPGMENIELHLYGSGDYSNSIESIANKHGNIRYFGSVDNKTIVKRQMTASLLINPRPIDAEFSAYSFPSKNMEYMLSGTPVLTTNLPGMPTEYKKYVYILNAESPEKIARKIVDIVEISQEERATLGKKACDFISKNKNNIVQTRHILDMIEKKLIQNDKYY